MGLTPVPERIDMMMRYYRMMIEANSRFNLTRITSEQDAVVKHFADSLTASPYIPEGATLCDIGSGAGFPAVPLAIMRPDLRITMVDSVGKKADFLQKVTDELPLPHCRVLNMRAEDLAGSERESFDAVTARAVAPMNTLAEYCMPLVKKGGIFVAYKTRQSDFDEGARAIALTGGRLSRAVEMTLPMSDIGRCIILIDKVSPTPAKYPRPAGKPRKSPL